MARSRSSSSVFITSCTLMPGGRLSLVMPSSAGVGRTYGSTGPGVPAGPIGLAFASWPPGLVVLGDQAPALPPSFATAAGPAIGLGAIGLVVSSSSPQPAAIATTIAAHVR